MKKILISALAISFLAACKKEESTSSNNAAPTVTLAENNNTRLSATVGNYAHYYALATDTDGDSTLSKVVFFANDVAYDTVTAESLKYLRINAAAVPVNSGLYFYADGFKSTVAGDVVFKAKAYDNKGGVGTSNTMTVTFSAPAVIVAAEVGEVKVK